MYRYKYCIYRLHGRLHGWLAGWLAHCAISACAICKIWSQHQFQVFVWIIFIVFLSLLCACTASYTCLKFVLVCSQKFIYDFIFFELGLRSHKNGYTCIYLYADVKELTQPKAKRMRCSDVVRHCCTALLYVCAALCLSVRLSVCLSICLLVWCTGVCFNNIDILSWVSLSQLANHLDDSALRFMYDQSTQTKWDRLHKDRDAKKSN